MPVRPVADSLIFPPPPDENEKRLMSYCTNPRLRARTPKAQEVYLEDVLGEVVTVKMLSKDATPVAFAVPDGTDAVEITIGPIEVDPDSGSADDLEQVVTIGELQIDGIDENGNTTGDQVTVTAPWRYASFVELASDHLRFPIYARFFQKILPM